MVQTATSPIHPTGSAKQTLTNRPRKSKVGFQSIEIIELEYCVGDHPCVTKGTVPLSVDWAAHSITSLPLEEFEQIRPPRQLRVRKFSSVTKHQLLLRRGHTQEEIQEATLEAFATKRNRISTLKQLQNLEHLNDVSVREDINISPTRKGLEDSGNSPKSVLRFQCSPTSTVEGDKKTFHTSWRKCLTSKAA